jgi:protein-glucosylgalactosylhydroxylysine glucosidase
MEKEPHYFVLMPGSENTQISVSVEFSEKNIFEEPLVFEEVNSNSEINWKEFWETGGAVDFSKPPTRVLLNLNAA